MRVQDSTHGIEAQELDAQAQAQDVASTEEEMCPREHEIRCLSQPLSPKPEFLSLNTEP